MGFRVSEIKGFIDKPDEKILLILMERRNFLKDEINRLTTLLQSVDNLLQTNGLNEEKILQIAKENELK